MTFDADRKGTGTAEWAETTANIQIGCVNDCLYCYAAHKAATMYGGWCKREEWHIERFTNKADRKSFPAKDGVVMFPSTHDITPFNLEACIRVLTLMLKKGNRVLIVTKPRIPCVSRMLDDLEPWKDQILFRFTIGSMSEATCSFWEPGAPTPRERVTCIHLAFERGFKTSVSIEPMLAGIAAVEQLVNIIDKSVTDTIWIGKMNKLRSRVDMSKPENAAAVENIEWLQRDSEIMRMYSFYNGIDKIRWKDSIKEVVARS